MAQRGPGNAAVIRTLHTSVRLVTFVDPVTGDPYDTGREAKGRTYRNPLRAAIRQLPAGPSKRKALRMYREHERLA